MNKPYIGVTGITTPEEAQEVSSIFTESGILYQNYVLPIPMIGILVSHKTLTGKKGRKRYPKFETLSEILEAIKDEIFTTVHYNSREANLPEQISQVFDGIYESNLCRGLQLNIVWPKVEEVARIKSKCPEMKIIFQASRTVLRSGHKKVAERIRGYGDSIDYVLLDPSGGRGMILDESHLNPFYQALRETLPDLAVGFAGGLCGDNVEFRIQNLSSQTRDKNFSIDAEGGLRDEDDNLDLEKVKAYIREASLAYAFLEVDRD